MMRYMPYYQERPSAWDMFGQGLLAGFQKGQEDKQNSDMYNKIADMFPQQQPAPVPEATTKGLFSTYQFNPSLANAPVTQYSDVLGQSPDTQKQFVNNAMTGAPQQQNFLNPNLLQSAAQPQHTQEEYDQFAQQKQEHPDWFVGDTYVGDDEQAKTNALAKQQPQAQNQPQAKQYSFSNPLGTPPQQTLTDVKNQHMRAMYQAAANLAKQGYDAKQFLPVLQQITNDKVNEATNQYNQQQVNGLMQQFNASNNPYERAFIAAKMGQYGMKIDPKLISTLQPNIKATTMNLGGTVQVVGYDSKDPNKVYNLATGEVTLNPNTKYTADMGYQGKIDAANIGASSRLQAAAMRGSGGGGRSSSGKSTTQKVQGKSGMAYTPMQVDQAQQDVNEYYQAQNDGTLELASPQDMKRWSKAAYIVNDTTDDNGDDSGGDE